MATDLRTVKKVKQTKAAGEADVRVFYLYAITRASDPQPGITAESVDGVSPVEGIPCEDYVCWISRVPRQEFAGELTERMQDLEWLASAGLRHQRTVAQISSQLTALPARFGTVFLTVDSMAQHVRQRRKALTETFARVADADEWGIKIFTAPRPKRTSQVAAATGVEYLKRKAENLRPRSSKTLDDDVIQFVQALTALSVAASPGGKASAGQPGLLWHGSFLVRRSDRKKLDAVLKKYAARWRDLRRIDCSGPWPPYSFVGDHAG
jgi:hypothetical protein